MATTFLEPGGDADFNVAITTGFWTIVNGTTLPVVATDFVHGTHVKSIKYGIGGALNSGVTKGAVMSDSGSRISVYLYLNALPNATSTIIAATQTAGTNAIIRVRLTSTGVLQLWNDTVQIGTNGATLSTGVWIRISLAYTVTSSTVNRFELFKDGTSTISVTNATLGFTGSTDFRVGNQSANATLDLRSSDHYVDNSSSLTDTGNIWVTAKRPFSNGSTNGFTTQIGSGGSGYGTGHAPQVNERPLNDVNGWSIVAVGVTTEEYNIEGQSVGDITTVGGTIIDYVGWVDTKSLIAETAQIIVNNVTSNIAVTTAETIFTKVAGSSTYPASTGTDIGMITSATATTVSLYECGVIVAFIPAAGSVTIVSPLSILGAG